MLRPARGRSLLAPRGSNASSRLALADIAVSGSGETMAQNQQGLLYSDGLPKSTDGTKDRPTSELKKT
jgi:hypothetical protein